MSRTAAPKRVKPVLTEEERRASFMKLVESIQQTPHGRLLVPEGWTIPQREERKGGYLAERWNPSCGEFVKKSHGWLELIHWDVDHPIDDYRLYNLQLLAKGEPLDQPFNCQLEGVTVEMADFGGRCVPASIQPNPEAFVGGSGDTFIIKYPVVRGVLNGDYDTVAVEMPARTTLFQGVSKIVF